ncbi:unnamed protein product, partial [Rotaria magnacalcarata]
KTFDILRRCSEKFGKSSNRAFRAFANNVGSAIMFVFNGNVELITELFCDDIRDNELVMIV